MYISYTPVITKRPENTIDICSNETGEILCMFDADRLSMESVITMLYKFGVTEMKIRGSAIYINKNLEDVFLFADYVIIV